MHIIATVGPKSLDKWVLKDFIDNGVNILRLNCSHFNEKEFNNIIKEVKKINKDMYIMIDLCGKKIRVSKNLNSVYKIYPGEDVYFCGEDFYNKIRVDNINDKKIIPLNIKSEILLSSSIDYISMKDNTMNFEIIDKNQGMIRVNVKKGGIIRSGKGCNINGVRDSLQSLTEKDKKDILWALKNNVDIICQSYVEEKEDIDEIIEFITPKIIKDKNIDIWAKVETPKGMENLEEITEKIDNIIIGRGDLVPEAGILNAVELEHLAIKFINNKKKNVILATHLLDSMKNGGKAALPEIESIYSFIKNGVNGFLLAGETSIGRAPVKTVQYLMEVIENYKIKL